MLVFYCCSLHNPSCLYLLSPLPSLNGSFLSLHLSVVPEAVVLSSTFQGTAATAETQRPPLNLDFPHWNTQTTLEDMELTCQRPTTVSTFTACDDFYQRLSFSKIF